MGKNGKGLYNVHLSCGGSLILLESWGGVKKMVAPVFYIVRQSHIRLESHHVVGGGHTLLYNWGVFIIKSIIKGEGDPMRFFYMI